MFASIELDKDSYSIPELLDDKKLLHILNSFVEKIIISETEWYAGRKMQEVKIIYKFVGAIRLPQYDVS